MSTRFALPSRASRSRRWPPRAPISPQHPRDAMVASPATGVFGLIGFSGRQGREPEQVEFLEALRPHLADDWWFQAVYAFALEEIGRLDEALDLIERSMAKNPEQRPRRPHQGACAVRAGRGSRGARLSRLLAADLSARGADALPHLLARGAVRPDAGRHGACLAGLRGPGPSGRRLGSGAERRHRRAGLPVARRAGRPRPAGVAVAARRTTTRRNPSPRPASPSSTCTARWPAVAPTIATASRPHVASSSSAPPPAARRPARWCRSWRPVSPPMAEATGPRRSPSSSWRWPRPCASAAAAPSAT